MTILQLYSVPQRGGDCPISSWGSTLKCHEDYDNGKVNVQWPKINLKENVQWTWGVSGGTRHAGFRGFSAALVLNPPQTHCLIRVAAPWCWWVLPETPGLRLETVVCYRLLRFSCAYGVLCSAEAQQCKFGRDISHSSACKNSVNVSLGYSVRILLTIAVWVADSSFREKKKRMRFALKLGQKSQQLLKWLNVLQSFGTVYSRKSELSVLMIIQIKVATNPGKRWRSPLLHQIFSWNLVLHVKVNEGICLLSLPICFLPAEWRDGACFKIRFITLSSRCFTCILLVTHAHT